MSPATRIPRPDPEADTQRRERRREADRDRLVRQRRRTAVGLLAGLALVAGIASGAGSGGGGDDTEQVAAEAEKLSTLPGGSRRIFPDHRVVAFYGAPQDDELGVLGIGDPMKVGKKLDTQAADYATKARPVLPAFELIATIAAADPGDDGLYRTRQQDEIIARYLKAARAANAMLLLDIQPGRADFLTEAKVLEKWLRQPDVGLALDPEWRMADGEVPGQSIGSVEAEEVNAVSAWLSEMVADRKLPEKMLIIHQFTEDMIQQPEKLVDPKGVALTLNVDGFGNQAQKVAKYKDLVAHKFHVGFKLFYREDEGLMKPKDVFALQPKPDLVVYE